MNSYKPTIQAYDQAAENYETKWKKYLKHTHSEFLQRIKTNENIILDVSAGTGLLAHELINEGYLFRELVLNDPPEEMLKLARKELKM